MSSEEIKSLFYDLEKEGCMPIFFACMNSKGARRLKDRKNYHNKYYPTDFVNRFKDRAEHETNIISPVKQAQMLKDSKYP